MAVNFNNHLARILDDTSDNRRDDIWLWHELTINHNFKLGELNDAGMQLQIKNLLSKHNHIKKEMDKKRSEKLLPIKYYEWINEGARQTEWMNAEILEHLDKYSSTHPIHLHLHLSGADLLLASFDLWDIDIAEKESRLYKLKQNWAQHKKGDKKFQWLKDEESKCLLAGEWLNSNIDGLQLIGLPPTVGQPINNYEDLLIFFDRCNNDQKTLYMDRIKKAWSQKKYRQGLRDKNKAQYNFVLSDKAMERLDNFAKDNELSRARILDILLIMESEKHSYIPEMLKRLKDGS
ncbi:hypothetical protein ACOI7N_26985 [Pseudomonas sp. P2758]|uniref:hypothetical protein n=1 Tax=Pseudomonas sp. P2758 TaxID=3409916 RepID=UPI003B5C82F3